MQKALEDKMHQKISAKKALIVALITALIIASSIFVDLSLNRTIVTAKLASKQVTVNEPFSVTISINRYAKNTQYYYLIEGYVEQTSAWMTARTMTINVTITEGDYQQLLTGLGIWGSDWNKPIPNSAECSLTFCIGHFTYGVTDPVLDGTASIKIIVNNSS